MRASRDERAPVHREGRDAAGPRAPEAVALVPLAVEAHALGLDGVHDPPVQPRQAPEERTQVDARDRARRERALGGVPERDGGHAVVGEHARELRRRRAEEAQGRVRRVRALELGDRDAEDARRGALRAGVPAHAATCIAGASTGTRTEAAGMSVAVETTGKWSLGSLPW